MNADETRAYRMPQRGAVSVRGADRARWLDGMLTQSISAFAPGAPFAYALALTHQGRIVADAWCGALHEDALLLDLERAAVAPLLSHLRRFVIADDVQLADESARYARFALEAPDAKALHRTVSALDSAAALRALPRAEYGLLEAHGVQLFAPAAEAKATAAALGAAGFVLRAAAEFEAHRIRRGVPWYGRELDSSVLPGETRLQHAISESKGCYAGQEVVARMRSRGRVASLLVALHIESAGAALPPAGAALNREGKRVGEITSIACTGTAAAIGLGFVKAACAEAGTQLSGDGFSARAALPAFAAADAAAAGP